MFYRNSAVEYLFGTYRTFNVAAFVRLEDGRVLWGSTMSIGGLLSLTAECITTDFPKLKRWLADKAERPAPFLHMDLGGLDPTMRNEFYAAAKRALDQAIADDPSLLERSYILQQLSQLAAMHASIERGEPPMALSDTDYVMEPISPEDLDEIWEI